MKTNNKVKRDWTELLDKMKVTKEILKETQETGIVLCIKTGKRLNKISKVVKRKNAKLETLSEKLR